MILGYGKFRISLTRRTCYQAGSSICLIGSGIVTITNTEEPQIFTTDWFNSLVSGTSQTPVKTGTCLQTVTIPKPYQGMNITGVTGLTEKVKATLKTLGGVEFL
jgi:hypothetical protein